MYEKQSVRKLQTDERWTGCILYVESATIDRSLLILYKSIRAGADLSLYAVIPQLSHTPDGQNAAGMVTIPDTVHNITTL